MYKLNICVSYFFLFYCRCSMIFIENRSHIVLYLFLPFWRNTFSFMKTYITIYFISDDKCLGRESSNESILCWNIFAPLLVIQEGLLSVCSGVKKQKCHQVNHWAAVFLCFKVKPSCLKNVFSRKHLSSSKSNSVFYLVVLLS